jgi:predicted DCC family thiol-disulfide oxidoreductase YuxK
VSRPELPDRDRAAGRIIVYFDGLCPLCDGLVAFLFRRDRRHRLRFAPLQGETAARDLPGSDRTDAPPSLVVRDDRGIHRRSAAVLAAFAGLGWPWRAIGVLRFVPRGLRDAGYEAVARRRRRWFGRRDSCRHPSPEERGSFLP